MFLKDDMIQKTCKTLKMAEELLESLSTDKRIWFCPLLNNYCRRDCRSYEPHKIVRTSETCYHVMEHHCKNKLVEGV